jgi:hypothetical protein
MPEEGDDRLAPLHVAHDAAPAAPRAGEHVVEEDALEQRGPVDADALQRHDAVAE